MFLFNVAAPDAGKVTKKLKWTPAPDGKGKSSFSLFEYNVLSNAL